MAGELIRFPTRRAPPVLPPSDGGGTYDGMEARVARLESDVGHISANIAEMKVDLREMRSDMKTDFRVLFGALITAALGLAALMAHGFKWI